jgi:predicted nucleic acid-binding protein
MFLDTSGLLCLFDKSEYRNSEAETFYDAATVRLTHSYVLAEFVALAHSRGAPREGSLTLVADIPDDPEIDFVWIDESMHREGVQLLQNRLDKEWSLCDAISILLMQQRGIMEALTTDHHFDQAGLKRLLP